MTSIERWLAPGILVAVALVQLLLAHTVGLSSWKGGGFGMFATVDSPGARIVGCEAVTTTGETIRVRASQAINDDRWDTFRAMPDERALSIIARSMLNLTYVRSGVRTGAANERFKAENPDLAATLDGEASRGSDFYRPLRIGDPDLPEDQLVRLQSVKLRWWSVTFNRKTKKLHTEPLGSEFSLSQPRHEPTAS